MYLLMLLATFVSAMYGYNLSARPDYDRDIARKKAMGVVYKFTFHTQALFGLVSRIVGPYDGAREAGLMWVQPEDLIYADFDATNGEAKDNKGTSLAYKQGTGNPVYFLLRRKNNNNGDNPVYYPEASGIEVKNYLGLGHFLFDGKEMMTKVMCLNKEMQETGATKCTSATDGDGNLTGSCCMGNVNRFLVSYKKFDVRFINRITNKINMDFWNAINERAYLDNIGIIQWRNGQWHFQGKINFPPVYAEEKKAYEEAHKNDPDSGKRYYPVKLKKRMYWDLPKDLFTENYFSDKNGQDMCKQSGCLFQIKYF